MRHSVIYGVSLLVLLVGSCAGNEVDDGEMKVEKLPVCFDQDKFMALAEVADDFTYKTKILLSRPDFATDCLIKQKAEKYLELTKKLLREIKGNIPFCKSYDCGNKPRDCSEVLANGDKKNGVYKIYPMSRFSQKKELDVYCDMETDGGGWTVIQRRGNFTPQQDFYQRWEQFRVGFGNIKRDFWLGNDNIYALSNQGSVELRIDLEDANGNRRYAVYKHFRVEDEENKYKLQISGYSGDANDGMTQHDGKEFSTKDIGVDEGVAEVKGAWWFNDWAHSHLNGLYLPGQDNPKSAHWYEWQENIGLAFTEMKVRLN